MFTALLLPELLPLWSEFISSLRGGVFLLPRIDYHVTTGVLYAIITMERFLMVTCMFSN